jgi:hypothetical protein
MSPQSQDPQTFARAERFRTLRDWAFGLAIVSFLLGIGTLGLLGQSNPKSATSAYAALQAAGFMRWLFIPMMVVSLGAVAFGLVAQGLSVWRSRASRT